MFGVSRFCSSQLCYVIPISLLLYHSSLGISLLLFTFIRLLIPHCYSGMLQKASVRDRHSSGVRRNSYNYDRSDHGDREGNWNAAKARAAGRSHNRGQAEKSRIDRLAGNESRSDRPWSTYRHEQIPSYQAQNGPLRPSSSQSSSMNVAYGMYPMPGMNPGGVTSNGSTAPSVVMVYPYDHNSGYISPGEQLEFGSLGPMSVGTNDASQPVDGNRLRRAFEDQRFHGGSVQQSSPDQPSSPHFQR